MAETEAKKKAHEVKIDSWDAYHRFVHLMAEAKSEWAGLPMPMEDLDLILEDRYPYKAFERIFSKEKQPDPGYKAINQWYSRRKGYQVFVLRLPDGKSCAGYSHSNQGMMLLNTIGASFAWTMENETTAIMKLGSLVPFHKVKQYALTGTFLETSPRSKITYLFRRLRPTLAFKQKLDPDTGKGDVFMICGLCLHPIGYYGSSWGGVMCPTDEVIAHLVMMRGDEHCYWKRANQHSVLSPLAGI